MFENNQTCPNPKPKTESPKYYDKNHIKYVYPDAKRGDFEPVCTMKLSTAVQWNSTSIQELLSNLTSKKEESQTHNY